MAFTPVPASLRPARARHVNPRTIRRAPAAPLASESRGNYHLDGPQPEPQPEPQPQPEPAREQGTEPDTVPLALARLAEVPFPDDPDGPEPPDHQAPFGLPVLDELPQLAAVLHDLRQVDRLISQVIDGLLLLEDTSLAEAATGLGLDTWLTVVGRRTGADVRMLRTTAKVMRRVPSLHAAFQAGRISWAQVRSVVLTVRPLPRHLDDRIDEAVAYVLIGAAETEPDGLTRSIRWHLDALDPSETEREQQEASEQEYLAMQPRLDGTGGRFWGELGATNWALFDAAINTALFDDHTPHTTETTEAGASSCSDPDADDAAVRDPDDLDAVDRHATPRRIRDVGRARITRLIDHLDSSMANRLAPPTAGAQAMSRPTGHAVSGPMRSRMQLLLRIDLSTLLDRDQAPTSLLTTLLGGHVRVTAATARALLQQRGADLRTVIVDDVGAVVGVGRRARVAGDWLNDATLALHDTCSFPGCSIAARRSQTDHAHPWHPARRGDPPGRTDIDQLAPLCWAHNQTKESDGWSVTQRSDGTRRWRHHRTGLSTTTPPVRPPSVVGSG